MGNRAVITASKSLHAAESNDIGIYLHWNGGRDSVEAFLKYCELRGFRSDCYGMARLAQVVGNFFGGGLSIGIDRCCNLDCDNWDNGVYIIDGWQIVGRQYFNGAEQNSYDLNEMLIQIDEAQPKEEQLGKEFLSALELPTEEIMVGDEVFVQQLDGRFEKVACIGIGEDRTINGCNVLGVPFTDRYGADNINSYLRGESYKVVKNNVNG